MKLARSVLPTSRSVFRSSVLLLLLLPIVSTPSYADVLTVPGDYGTIQAAIDASVDDDEIIVSPGTYVENINFNGKNITLRSTDPTDPDVVANTVIDGDQASHTVLFSGEESPDCILAGFTITNGAGAGILGSGTLATIEHNIIRGNSSPSGGGGLGDCDGAIRHNIISDHWCEAQPGAPGLYRCDGTISNNLIARNSARGLDECDGIIMNNTVVDNGRGLQGCDGIITNNTVVDNGSYGFYLCHGLIANCIIWGNGRYSSSPPLYCCIENWTEGGLGNIAADPRFADPASGDYHLQSESPCIDAGNTYWFTGDYLADIDRECRLAGVSVDMGSDEHGSSPDTDGDFLPDSGEASHGSDPNESDSDGDGLMDGLEVIRNTDPAVYETPPGLSVPADAPSVGAGVFLAFPSEIVTVSPGTYYDNVRFTGRNVVLQSTNPQDDDIVSSTIIDGRESAHVIRLTGTEDESCVIRGLTIRNGYGYGYRNGGGICGNGSLATIEHNRIVDNRAASDGGGIYECDGMIQRNIISNNAASDGAGDGGGLARCHGTIRNNVISGNTAGFEGVPGWDMWPTYGSGGALYDCDGIIQNNTIFDNYGGEDGRSGISYCDGAITNCIVWESGGVGDPVISYSCIQDWEEGGEGNISSDPQFLAPYEGDFHLLSNSPCIDAGGYIEGLFADFEGDTRGYDATEEPRGDGSDYDIGADEYVEYADADGDVLPDWVETGTGIYVNPIDTGTDPNNPDTDGDGLSDGDEVYTHSTDPNLTDTDGDGLTDPEEIATHLTDPVDADSDDDGLTDGEEVNDYPTDPLDADTDNDGMPDGWEVGNGLNPLADDSAEDADTDGLTNLAEFDAGCDPTDADTDDDELADGEEVNLYLTNPLDADTDGDGYTDGTEVAQGTDPLDPASHPGPVIPPPPPPPTTQPRTGGRGGAGGPGCFIATAAYGTPLAGEVGILSDFRDRFLLTNRVGTAFVRTYYRFSPPIARFIANHELLRAAVRTVLTPIVAIARGMLDSPITVPLTAIAGLGLIGLTGLFRAHRRRAGPTYEES